MKSLLEKIHELERVDESNDITLVVNFDSEENAEAFMDNYSGHFIIMDRGDAWDDDLGYEVEAQLQRSKYDQVIKKMREDNNIVGWQEAEA